MAAKIVMRSAVGVPCRIDEEAPESSGLVPAFAAPTGTRPVELLPDEGGDDPLVLQAYLSGLSNSIGGERTYRLCLNLWEGRSY